MAEVVLCGDPLEIVTTDPALSPRPRSSAARIKAMVGQVLSRMVSRSCSSLMASNESGWGAPPTVLTTRSMRPNASIARSVSTATAASVSIDPTTPTTRSPSARMAASAEATRPASRPLITTEAPPRASRRAHDRPMLGSARGTGHHGHPAREPLVTPHRTCAAPRVCCRLRRLPCPSVCLTAPPLPIHRAAPTRRGRQSPFGRTAASSMAFMIGPAIPAPVSTKF